MTKSIISVTEPFKIIFGNGKPLFLQSGFLERGNASIKSGEPIVEVEAKGGDYFVPTFFEAWGRRVINGKPINKQGLPVQVSDLDYVGDIEFLKPTDTDGYLIQCRYMPESSSLDYQFQIIRQSLPNKENDKGYTPLVYERGEHTIDPSKNKTLALCLKVNPYNETNKLKMPRYTQSFYSEIIKYDVANKTMLKSDISFEAVKLIKESADDYAKVELLFNIIEEGGVIEYDKKDENGKYKALRLLADENPEKILSLVDNYKNFINDIIEKTKSENLFDTTVNGTLKIGKTKKEILLDGIIDEYKKGEDMIQYLFDYCLTPKVYNAIQKLKNYLLK